MARCCFGVLSLLTVGEMQALTIAKTKAIGTLLKAGMSRNGIAPPGMKVD
jgi:hypothetical protein